MAYSLSDFFYRQEFFDGSRPGGWSVWLTGSSRMDAQYSGDRKLTTVGSSSAAETMAGNLVRDGWTGAPNRSR